MTPSESLSTQCPDNPCHTLQHYVEHGNYYFQLASDCTFQFLPGNHILSADEIVFIRYVTNFALSGSGNTSVIECLGATGFCFLNTINVTVANLTFMFCGGMSPYLSPATLTFGGWAFDVKILEITVINGTGYGVSLPALHSNGHELDFQNINTIDVMGECFANEKSPMMQKKV